MKTALALPKLAPIWLLSGIFLVLPAEARAEFFKYKDSSGAVVITDKLDNVPKKYRSRVKVIWDEDLDAKDPLARRRAQSEKLREQRESQQNKDLQKTAEKRNSDKGKTLVISIDEETGQLIRRFE
ncbi:MAG: hypothetical protein M0023_16305 [Desulfobacteraceae bacterium]|nr:hypothetical protein [Desulfobacteraceae bacterium]